MPGTKAIDLNNNVLFEKFMWNFVYISSRGRYIIFHTIRRGCHHQRVPVCLGCTRSYFYDFFFFFSCSNIVKRMLTPSITQYVYWRLYTGIVPRNDVYNVCARARSYPLPPHTHTDTHKRTYAYIRNCRVTTTAPSIRPCVSHSGFNRVYAVSEDRVGIYLL